MTDQIFGYLITPHQKLTKVGNVYFFLGGPEKLGKETNR